MDFIQNAYESEQEEGHCQNTIEHQEAKYHAIEDAIQEEDCKRKRIAEKFMQRQKNFQHKHHKATKEEKDFLYRKYQCKRHHSVNQQEKRNKVEKELDHINVSPLVDELFSTLDEKQPLLETHKTSSKWHCHERILAHSSQVNFIDWNKQYPSLLLSCSMDSTLCVWHHIPNTTICRRQMNGHSKGVSDAKWTLSGRNVLSVGYDKKILLWDVEKAQQPLQTWTHTNYVTCICPHPSDPNVFLVGTTTESGHNSGITCYDQRNPNAIKEYKRHFGGVLDLVFLPSGKEFLSSCMLQSTSTTDRSLLIWDFESTTLLQDQISMDLSMFPSLSLHPLKPLILAQSNFQHTRVLSYKPSINKWKFLQKKRFSSGHEVDNLRIKCSVNSNGQLLATGDTKGRLVVYDFETTKVLQCFSHAPSQKAACLGGVFHPLNPSLLASYGQDGTIGIYLC